MNKSSLKHAVVLYKQQNPWERNTEEFAIYKYFNPLTTTSRKYDDELWEFFLTQPFNRSKKFFFWSMRRKRMFPVTSLPAPPPS